MKKLSELGISPTPWKVIPYGKSTDSKTPTNGDIEFANGETMYLRDVSIILPMIADARLIAAAPKLYEVCYRIERWEDYAKAHNKVIESWSYIMHDLHKALAEAAGEEVGDGK